MPLSSGDQFGPYTLISAIGRGGMGEVWKASDTRLDRIVALKFSAEQFSERFGREARAVAALNHPNVCTLYDVGPNYLVMEYIEGKPLEGPLPLDKVLAYTGQICDALDAAHRKGIVHRDLKPANILATKQGVKVLDFGIAAMEGQPTLTKTGAAVGTPAYMSPEQWNGNPADARSDIYSLGCVIHELATGDRVPHKTLEPPALDQVVKTCIATDPEDRWQSAREIKLALEFARRPQPKTSGAGWMAAAALACVLVAAGIGWYSAATRPVPPRPLLRLDLAIDPSTPLARVRAGAAIGSNMLALSPDGARVALTLGGADGKVRLHTRLLHHSQVMPLAGTENAYEPFFSPAGDWIGFFADGKLKKIAVEGGAVVTLCDAPLGYGGSWGDDGTIIAALDFNTVLSRIPAAGGTPAPVTRMVAGEETHRWPQVLPGSQIVLFTASTVSSASYDDATIEVISLRTGERKTLHRGGLFGRYLADATGSHGTGHLVYLNQSTAFAVPFHSGKLALAGTPAPILEDVSSTPSGGGDFAFAQNGTFVYLAVKPYHAGWPISWVDGAGKMAQQLHAPLGQYYGPRISPDGKRLAFSMGNGKGQDIWVKDLDRDTPSRLSFQPGQNAFLVWSPDGKSIVFRSTSPAAPGLYAIRSDGSGEAKRLTEDTAPGFPNSFSPDGKRLAIARNGNGGSLDIFTLPVEADPGPGGPGFRLGKPDPFLGTPFMEFYAAFSPDGRWLAYESNESGTYEVYVRSFSAPGGRWQVSTGGGRDAIWSRDGRELLFRTPDGRVMATAYTAKGDSFVAGKPRVWTESRVRAALFSRSYDITPDGRRLAAIVADDSTGGKLPAHLTFLLNFFDELQRKAPLAN